MRTVCLFLLAGVPLVAVTEAPAQDKKNNDKKAEPKIALILPLGAAPGKTTKLTIRGFRLDQAKAVELPPGSGSVKILSKGAAPVPDKNPEQVGDTQVVVEVALSEKVAGNLKVKVATPAGTTPGHDLLVESGLPVVAEKEGNDGFAMAQAVPLPGTVAGAVDRPRDVDVFRVQGKPGQKVRVALLARRHGSGLDGLATIYDAKGNQVAFAERTKGDPETEFVLPADGLALIVVQDAHDTGGSTHVYRLVLGFRGD